MADEETTGIAAATGSASGKRGGNFVERAMTQALLDLATETQAVNDDPDLTDEAKRERIAAMNEPSAVKQRMIDARAKAKAERAELQSRTGPAAQVQNLKDQSGAQ